MFAGIRLRVTRADVHVGTFKAYDKLSNNGVHPMKQKRSRPKGKI